ncbi:hypothetical protein niasHT_008777 [Heterodera trifolii]|uniref:CCHC-type domain-containing protein n=1 Tax=Heterodera trifolii TaxID=157864 RepID=A0ABD2M5Q7_9BILA
MILWHLIFFIFCFAFAIESGKIRPNFDEIFGTELEENKEENVKSHGDAALRQRILSKLTADGDNITYDAVVEDCMNFMTTIAEAKVIESSSSGSQRSHAVNAVHPKREKPKYERPKSQQSTKTEQQKCWRCGQTNHHHAACPQKGYKCRKCSQNGHIESRCEAVQEWRKKNAKSWLKKNVGNVNIVTVNIGTTAKPTTKSTLLRVKVLSRQSHRICPR